MKIEMNCADLMTISYFCPVSVLFNGLDFGLKQNMVA